ncbi:F0F1 ATP synthase subunit epsilon [Aliiruegeria sabulilitoris]|uniref:F0F1 ATP synthase subunit epsilon n=1 Tax=Aliiruegeria sabulilitoris TaxID=1510458 RepID=UPI0008324063|nr:F0F1 ATP synthase subunit epsilon [Aliiruegeria sabulilitoris]NDR58437.1 F0F1 ATP synthase subunit epsilon [Pseudoruegeria sp. M32A2M]
MKAGLHLNISTPTVILVEEPAAQSVRAEDESGGFGILPGHTEFLTALPASVVRWRDGDGRLRFCALRAGLMTVSGGNRVSIACREGILGDDLAALEAEVAKLRAAERDADRRARVEHMRLHASAVRQIIRYLRPGQAGALDHPPRIAESGDGARS